MNFVEQLQLEEKAKQEREQYEKEHYDEIILPKIIETIVRECRMNRSNHSLTGSFTTDSGYGDYAYLISKVKREDIPKTFEEDGDYIYGIVPNNPQEFEVRLKQAISDLGFDSSKCGLIPLKKRNRIFTKPKRFGIHKYDATIIYVVWIDLSW